MQHKYRQQIRSSIVLHIWNQNLETIRTYVFQNYHSWLKLVPSSPPHRLRPTFSFLLLFSHGNTKARHLSNQAHMSLAMIQLSPIYLPSRNTEGIMIWFLEALLPADQILTPIIGSDRLCSILSHCSLHLLHTSWKWAEESRITKFDLKEGFKCSSNCCWAVSGYSFEPNLYSENEEAFFHE